MCTDSKNISQYYYFEDLKFKKCSDYCLICESKLKCFECQSGYFLKFNNISNYSCSKCSDFTNCSNCIIANKTQKIDSINFDSMNSIETFNYHKLEYNWDIICLTCPSNYLRKTDSKCYKCTDEISNCVECAYISSSQNIENYGENLIFQDLKEDFFVICLTCDVEKNKFLQIEIQTDIILSKCVECGFFIPFCTKCITNILLEGEKFENLSQIVAFRISEVFFIKVMLVCLECENKLSLFSENNNYSCKSCPSNCEYCYLNPTILTIFCGRCEENYVLSFYEGNCYHISQYNITEEYQNSCSRIISENPFASYFFDSSFLLCQKCRDTKHYPSLNGNCMACLDFNCEICEESNAPGAYDSVIYTNLLYKSPYLLLDLITTFTYVFEIQKCLKCSSKESGYNQANQVCCAPSGHIFSTEQQVRILISGCQSCSYCELIEKSNSFGCTKCSKCEDVSEDMLNDENNIMGQNHLTSFYAKKIYYQLISEGNTYNTTPSFNETNTYIDIYFSLNSQKQVDLLGKSIYKCTPCPINSIDCTVSKDPTRIPNPSLFKLGVYDFSDLMSYYLIPTKCRNNFVYDFAVNSSRCKFCPNKWRNCRAFKIIEIDFIGQSKQFNQITMVISLRGLIVYLNDLELSEFVFICNEFVVKEIEIHILLDIDEVIIWENPQDYSMILESSLKSRIPSLEKYELIFIPKHFEANTFATLEMGCYITFKGYTSVKFINIIFKPMITSSGSLNNFPDLKLTPYIEINAGSIFLKGCFLISDQISENDSRISSVNILSFLLIADFVEIENFQIKNLKLKNFDAISLLNLYHFFEIKGQKVSLKNITFDNLIIYNIFSVFYFPALEGSSQNLEYIQIFNCELSESIFFRLGSYLSLNFNYLYIYNTSFLEKPIITSLLETVKSISISNIRIEKCSFFGISNINYVFSLNFFKDVKNVVIKDSYFSKTIIFFCIDKAIFVNEDVYFQNIFFLRNVLKDFEERFPFLISFEFSEFFQFAINLENISLENNLIIHQKKINIYAVRLKNINSIYSENCLFFNNFNVSAIHLESFNSVQCNKFIFAKENSIIDQSQDQIVLYMLNIQNSIKLENFNVDTMSTQQGIIIIIQEIYETNVCQLFFKNSILNYILIHNMNLASAFFIYSMRAIEINIIESKFSNLILDDESESQKSSTALYVDSSFSSCKIEKSLFFNGFSNGESNFIRIFVNNLAILDSNMSLANYFNESTYSTKISDQGSFINADLINLIINSSLFSKAYSLNGGAIYSNFLNRNGSMKINNCSFKYLFALSEGGAFFISKTNDKNLILMVTDCIFKFVFALTSGGVFAMKTLRSTQVFIINSYFSNINSATGSFFSASNVDIKLSLVNFSENYRVFNQENFDFLFGLKDFEFSSLLQIGSLISLKFGELHFSKCNFYNLSSSTLYNEGTILDCLNCVFSDTASFYRNIYFWKYVFSFINSIATIKESSFSNISAESFSKEILNDGFFFKLNQKSYYSVFLLSDSYFNIFHVTAENIECQNCFDGGGFLLASNAVINTSFSSFRSNTFVLGLFNGIDCNVTLHSSYFEKNKALKYGGSLFFRESNVLVLNSYFLENMALNGEGGAIYFYSESGKNFSIINSCFENNIAFIGGAVFYQKISILLDSLTSFKNNKALLHGNNLFSFPFSLCFAILNKCEEKIPDIEGFRSGAYLNNIKLKMLDEEGNMIIYENSNSQIISMNLIALNSNSSNSSEDYLLYSMNYTKNIYLKMNEEGIFSFDNLLLIGKPETDIQIEFSSIQIMSNTSTTGLKTIRNYSISLFIHFRNCELGEYYQKITGTCFLCLNGTYSYNPLIEVCKDCLPGLNCLGGDETLVYPNFWRSQKFSEKVIYCSLNPDNCLGGKGKYNDLCLYGHIGAKCESCDLMGHFWNTSFSRSSNNECIKCDEAVYNYAILTILSLFNFFSMILSVKGTIDNINTRLKLKVIKSFARYGMFLPKKDESSINLKIYFSYLQIIQVLTALNLSYPSWINLPGATFGAPTNSILYSLDCLVAHISTTIPYVHVKLIAALFVPFLYLIIFTFGYVLFMKKSKYHHKYSMLYTVCLFTLLYFQPSMIDNIISVLSCVKVGDENYIKADVAYECTGDEYEYYSIIIGIPSLFFWGFAAPLTILYRLVKNRKDLQSITNQIRYGYLYDEYIIFYWEFVRMYEKISIIVILSFFDSEILIKSLLVLMIIFTYSLLIFKNHPYKAKKLNRTDKINSIVCYLSIFLGILTYKNTDDLMIALIFILILSINICFNVYMLKNIFSSIIFALRQKFHGLYYKFHDKNLIKKYPFLFKKKKFTKWQTARRLLGKYLRERERIKLIRLKKLKTDEERYRLSIIDYTSKKSSIKQKEIQSLNEENRSYSSSNFQDSCSELVLPKGDIRTFISNKNSKNQHEKN